MEDENESKQTGKAMKVRWGKIRTDLLFDHKFLTTFSREEYQNWFVIYMHLMLESMHHNGRIRYSEDIPFTFEELAVLCHVDIDCFTKTVDKLKKRKLLEVEQDGTIVIPEAVKYSCVGHGKVSYSSNPEAERKRKQRAAKRAGQTACGINGMGGDEIPNVSASQNSKTSTSVEKDKPGHRRDISGTSHGTSCGTSPGTFSTIDKDKDKDIYKESSSDEEDKKDGTSSSSSDNQETGFPNGQAGFAPDSNIGKVHITREELHAKIVNINKDRGSNAITDEQEKKFWLWMATNGFMVKRGGIPRVVTAATNLGPTLNHWLTIEARENGKVNTAVDRERERTALRREVTHLNWDDDPARGENART